MRSTDIIRIHEIDFSKCSHAIHVGDAVIQIDGITIDNWSYKDLTQYLCSNVIASIEAIGYFHYKKRKLNNDFDSPKSHGPRGPRGSYKKMIKTVYSTTTPDILSVNSNDNICIDSGTSTLRFNLN